MWEFQAKSFNCLNHNNFELILKHRNVREDLYDEFLFTWISDTNTEICFMSLSMDDSFPVFNNVVIAKVAIDRFWSEIRFSISRLQLVTESGFFRAIWLIARTAPNRRTGFDDDKNSWSTETAGCSSLEVTSFKFIIALGKKLDYEYFLLALSAHLAASKITISDLFLKQPSRKSKNGLGALSDGTVWEITWEHFS